MEVEWDPGKASANQAKHGVDFADAVTVLHDDFAVTLTEDHASEVRYVTLGMDALGPILVVVYTLRDDVVRLISVRKASPHERKQYEG